MRTDEAVPAAIVRRAAAIARGPHACPSCEAPTWAEPPVPWTGLRDYVVRCDSCERPVAIRVDRELVRRKQGAVHSAGGSAVPVDAVTELLDRRGVGAFLTRVLAAMVVPVVLACCVVIAGGGPQLAALIVAVSIIPGALWGPALLAISTSALGNVVARARRQPRGGVVPVGVEAARWDQWLREEKRSARERAEHPDAVLSELERVLDERELRRVRALAERGEVPAGHLEDLLRHRRTWTSVA